MAPDLTGAVLAITSLKGTDLTHVKGLTQAQLNQACGDSDTKVPRWPDGAHLHLTELARKRLTRFWMPPEEPKTPPITPPADVPGGVLFAGLTPR